MANSRDYSQTHDFSGTANDVTYGLMFNPAGQVIRRDVSNAAYQFPMVAAPSVAYVPDGLNQYDSVGGTAFTYDLRGNLTNDGVRAFTYDVLNRLVQVPGGGTTTSVTYDPLGRIHQVTSGGVTSDWLWDGDRLVAEYNSAGTLTARYAKSDSSKVYSRRPRRAARLDVSQRLPPMAWTSA